MTSDLDADHEHNAATWLAGVLNVLQHPQPTTQKALASIPGRRTEQ